MNVEQYAVSVQWGKGMHYFRTTELVTLAEAERVAKDTLDHAIHTRKASKAHAHPVVHIWQIKEHLHE